MAKKRRFIPFRWLPASWGLVGKPYEIAEAHYTLEGEDLERALIQINYGSEPQVVREQTARMLHRLGKIDARGLDVELAAAEFGGEENIPPKDQLAIDLAHGALEQYDYQRAIVKLDSPDAESIEHKKAMLKIEYDFDKINQNAYEKSVANLTGEPWVGIIDHGFNPQDGINGVYFEFDWNKEWIDFLRTNGYHGKSEEEIVEQWFSHVCRTQSEETPYESEPVPFNSGRVIRQIKGNDGKTGYS